jgi:hypothetical protein
MRRRRFAANLVSAIVGACVGGAAVLSLGGGLADEQRRREPPVSPANLAEPAERAAPQVSSKILLGWALGGLPPGTESTLEALPAVRDATTVRAGLDWVASTRGPDGSIVDNPRGDYMIPFETAIVEPKEYARFVSPVDRPAIESLRAHEMLIAHTESELRRTGEGATIQFRDRSVRIAGTVADDTSNGYEGLMRGPAPASWQRVDSFVLVHLKRPSARRSVERTIRSLLAPQQVMRVRAQGETPFLRYGDAVLPQMLIKNVFGEFAAQPLPTGAIRIQPGWVKRNIKRARVPILGQVECHKSLFPQLRGAIREVIADGLTYAINPDDFGGCYSPRFIDSDPGGRLSHHSWGIAVDINVAENAFNSKPDQDERLVRVMEEAGFTWGGRWLAPDGMHFEWVDWP